MPGPTPSRRRRAMLTAALIFSVGASEAKAERPAPSPVSGMVAQALRSDQFLRARAPGSRLNALPITVRLRDLRSLHALQRRPPTGLTVRAVFGDILVGRASPRAVSVLANNPDILRIELDTAPSSPPPIAQTAAEVQAPSVWHTLPTGLTGKGVLIADIDTGIDVFHPAFFRRGTTYLRWLDVNGNNVFDPGIDAIDLDGNGEAEAIEQLNFLDRGLFSDSSFVPIFGSDNNSFDVGDTLYVDSNRNGKRDSGVANGFDDTSATLGELLVLVDDVNGNGILDLGEKLVPQAESKIRAVFDGERAFSRGLDLSEAPGREGVRENHGTQVAGTILGGDARLGDMIGIAPDAELAIAVYSDGKNFSELLVWAVESGAKIILHEYAPWTGYHLDGSSNYEHMLDIAAAQGILHVNPVGNLGGSRKHARIDVPPQGNQGLSWRLPGLGIHRLEMTSLWRETERSLEFSLRPPSGDRVELGGTSAVLDLPGGGHVSAARDDSMGGTAMFHIVITGEAQLGDWRLEIRDGDDTALDQSAAALSIFLSDDRSGWGIGARFLESVSEEHLLTFPSTANSALGVAAYTGHDAFPINTGPEVSGENRAYSGRGLRIDGQAVVAISAPDNPLVATNERVFTDTAGTRLGDLSAFSGTSGAGAHVAGAAALMVEANPLMTMLEFREALRAGAKVDSQVIGNATHSREEIWGAGKLRVYRSIFGEDPVANSPPSMAIANACGRPGVPIELSIEVSDPEEASGQLRVQFDDDYDGEWDAPPAALTTHSLPGQEAGRYFSKARVIDSQGATGEALVEAMVQSACVVAPGESDAGDAQLPHDGADCGCRGGGTERSGLPALLVLATSLVGLALLRRRRAQHARKR